MLTKWMRIVGFVYLIKFIVMAIIKAPEILGTRFFLNEIMIGVEWGVLGATLIAFSKVPERAAALIWVILVLELFWIIYDMYILIQGFETAWFGVWMGVHIIIMITGISALRKANTGSGGRNVDLSDTAT